jgi:hypothetical protein
MILQRSDDVLAPTELRPTITVEVEAVTGPSMITLTRSGANGLYYALMQHFDPELAAQKFQPARLCGDGSREPARILDPEPLPLSQPLPGRQG